MYLYDRSTPNAILGQRGLDDFSDQITSLMVQLDDETTQRDAKGAAKGKLTLTFEVEVDGDGHRRLTYQLKTSAPPREARRVFLKVVAGEVMVEREDDTQARLPGFDVEDLEAQKRLREQEVARRVDEEIARREREHQALAQQEEEEGHDPDVLQMRRKV